MTPIGQCWRMKTENNTAVAVLYFGYVNTGNTNVNIPVSENNYFTSPPETGVDPITSFLPGYHGFSQLLVVGPELWDPTTVSISWMINGLYATVNVANQTQACSDATPITLTISASNAVSANTSAIVDAFVETANLAAGQVAVDASNPASTVVTLSTGGSTISQFEATAVVYSSFANPSDGSFRGALEIALNATIDNLTGGSTPQDAPGVPTAPPTAPVTVAPADQPFSLGSVIIPIAHCWEPVSDAQANYSYFYFGYMSTYSSVQTIEAGTKGNVFLGAPDTDLPFPVFYPGVNGFVSRLRVPTSSLIQWNLAGYAVLLDGADANFACDDLPNTQGLPTIGAWGQGTVSTQAAYDATLAVSTVSRLPESNVQSSWTNVTSGGFRGLFNLTAGNNETVYTSVWRTVADFHSASNSTLNTLWTGIFGVNADNYSCEGTAKDILGSPLPSVNDVFIPVSHCWMNGLTATTKYVYFGYMSNYEHTLSYLPSSNNWIANVQGYQVPTTFAPGYNGFSASVTMTSDVNTPGTNISWNLAGYTAGMDLTDTNKKCNPMRTISFTITYTGVLLDSFDQYAAADATRNYLNSLIPVRTLTVQLDPIVGGFLATATATPDANQGGSQYQGVTNFIQMCNSINSYTVRSQLSSLAGNATVTVCQGNGLVRDTNGVAGTTAETKKYGVQKLSLQANCAIPNGNGVTAFFGYKLDSSVYYTVPSTFTSKGTVTGQAPATFIPGSNAYAVRVDSTDNTVQWNVGADSARVDATTAACPANTPVSVFLSFERAVTSPPDMSPILDFIAGITNFPGDSVSGLWTFQPDNQDNFILTVLFSPYQNKSETIIAANLLVRQVTDNSTATAAISTAAALHLYSASTSSIVLPPPVAPVAPVAPVSTPTATPNAAPSGSPTVAPAPGKKKGLPGIVVFGIIIGVLLGVGIIGAILFFICKYKGGCRDDVETRPLLAETD